MTTATNRAPTPMTQADVDAMLMEISDGHPELARALLTAVPLGMLRRVNADLDRNPKPGPRYAGGDARHDFRGRLVSGGPPQDMELRYSFNVGRVAVGIRALLDELGCCVTGDATITHLVCAAEAEARADGRLAAFDRTHDLPELAGHIAGIAQALASVRKALGERRTSARHGGESLSDLRSIFGPPQWQIRRLARLAISRWLPAVQNIISRLPPSERSAAVEDGQIRLRGHLLALSKLSTLCRKASDEYGRWERGYGAVDHAVLESASMVTYARELAHRMEDDGSEVGRLAGPLRCAANEAASEAVGALTKLATERFDVMNVEAWVRHKGDMVRFGRATGGIAPGLEVLYHAKGSKFLGY